MYCSNCGAYVTDGNFCGNCGSPVKPALAGWYNTGSPWQSPPQVRYPAPVYTKRVLNVPDTPEKEMKRGFNRGGLAVLALYGSFSVLGSAFLYIAAIIAFACSSFAMGEFVTGDTWDALYEILYSSDAMGSPGALFVVLSYVVGMILGLIIGIKLMQKILKRINPVAPEVRELTPKEFFLAMAFTFGAWGLGVALGNLPDIVFPTESAGEQLYEALGMNMLPFYIYTIVGAPILEELSFRKVLCGGLSKFGKAPAVIVSALLFGLMHRNSGQFFLAFFGGLVFGCVYLYSGKIIYSILLHGIINFIASLPQLFALGNIDIELGWEIAVGVLGLIGVLFIIMCRKHPMLHPEPSPIPNSRKAVFANVGMRLAVIGGLVLTVFADIIAQYNAGEAGACLLQLFVSSVTIALVIVVITCTCKGKKQGVSRPE
ncbi:MAG: CPBP family glutamic-type intramembrane protease [Bacillota bacterium]|nr:CPBP family glutamic-type intramembrane protease [Bacillota bacterium]